MSAGRERTKSKPSQNKKRRRVSTLEHSNNVVQGDEVHAADDVQVKEEPHDNKSDTSGAQQVEQEPHDDDDDDDDVEGHQLSESISKYYISRPRAKGSKEHRSITVSISDPDVLHCPICFDSLSIPVYQCENGHIVCSACRINLGKKCATCSLPIGSNRCRAFEKILESIKIPCPNADHGCKETSSYSEKNNHELECIYVPCSCPIADCDFVASSKELSLHFCHDHDSGEIFLFDIPFSFRLKTDDESIIIQEGIKGNLFVLDNHVLRVGNAVSVSCIGPNSKPRNRYDILAKSQGCSLEFKPFTKNIQQSDVGTLSSRFLLIPFNYFGASETRKVEICIRSNDA